MSSGKLTARLAAGFAVFCVTSSVFAQNRSVVTQPHPQVKGNLQMEDATKCPVIGGMQRPASERTTAAGGMSNGDWWPNQLNLRILR